MLYMDTSPVKLPRWGARFEIGGDIVKVKELYYERINNLGNYENEKLGIRVLLDDDDDVREVYKQTKRLVEKQLGVWGQ